MSRTEISETIVHRLKTEFGYKSVKPYRIYSKDDGGAVMYYMIHATDHPDGPVQMARAYRNTVRPDDPYEDRQQSFDFEGVMKEPAAHGVVTTPLSA